MAHRFNIRPPARRGVALLMVVVAIAVLTAVGVDFAYNSRVDLQLAQNQRDELRAYYLARSGLGMSRLLLRFQRQLDQMPNLPGLGGLLAGLNPGGNAAQGGFQPSGLNIQLWRLAKVNCHLMRGVLGGVEPVEGKKLPDPARLGQFQGCFQTEMSDEEEKLNLNKLDAPQLDALPIASRAFSLFGDKRFSFLYEKPDAHGVKVTPTDTLISLRDWIDEDETQSSLNLTGQGDVFMRGFSDEASNYSSYNPRYRPKNARFDSLEELSLAHGVSDRWMAAFRDRVTVYPDVNAKLNINTDDPMLLSLAIMSVADPTRPDPRLQNPLFIEGIIRQIRTARSFSFLGMSVQDFVSIVEASGVAVDRTLKINPSANRVLSDKSTTYRLKVTGEAGDVHKTLTAVVRLNDGMGTVVYYRED
jgi:general secretion pathway protein K